MKINNCKYIKDEMQTEVIAIKATINDQVWTVPLDPENTEYAEIMRQVDENKLTIEETS